MNICYLKFINFSLGAGGMVRQNLQWKNSNDTFSIQSLSLFETIFLGEDVDGRLWKHSTRASSERQARFRRHVLFIPWEKYLAETPPLALFDHTHSHVYSALPEAMHPRISASPRLSGSVHLSPWNSHCANWLTPERLPSQSRNAT